MRYNLLMFLGVWIGAWMLNMSNNGDRLCRQVALSSIVILGILQISGPQEEILSPTKPVLLKIRLLWICQWLWVWVWVWESMKGTWGW